MPHLLLAGALAFSSAGREPAAAGVHHIDADGSGTYALPELYAAAERLGCKCLLSSPCLASEAETVTVSTTFAGYEEGLAAMFARYDVDGDGEYTREESDAHHTAIPNLVKITMAHCHSVSSVKLAEPAEWTAARAAAAPGRRLCNVFAGQDCAGANGLELITGSQSMPVPVGF